MRPTLGATIDVSTRQEVGRIAIYRHQSRADRGGPSLKNLSPALFVAIIAVTGSYTVGDERHGTLGLVLLAVAMTLALVDLMALKHTPRLTPTLFLLVPFVSWTIMSATWSLQPDVTVQAAIRTIAVIVVGVLIGMTTPLDRQILTLAVLGIIWSLVAVLTVLLGIQGAIDQDTRGLAWRGAFISKNSLGRAVAIAMLGILAMWLTRPNRRLRWLLGAMLCAFVIWRSMSVASWIIPSAVLASLAIWRGTRWVKAGTVAGIYVLGIEGMKAVAQFAGFVGRDATLTGRVPLWHYVEDLTSRSPWLGFGYESVWTSELGQSITLAQGWLVGHSHSGALEMRLGLGWVGLVAMCILLGGVSALHSEGKEWRFWPITLALGMVLGDLVEVTSSSGLSLLLLSATLAAFGVRNEQKGEVSIAHLDDRVRV